MNTKYIVFIFIFISACKTPVKPFYTQINTVIMGADKMGFAKDSVLFTLEVEPYVKKHLGVVRVNINHQLCYKKDLSLSPNKSEVIRDSFMFVNTYKMTDCRVEVFFENAKIYAGNTVPLGHRTVLLKYTYDAAMFPDARYIFVIVHNGY